MFSFETQRMKSYNVLTELTSVFKTLVHKIAKLFLSLNSLNLNLPK